MSMHYYSTSGYGCEITHNNIKLEELLNLIALAQDVNEDFKKYLKDIEVDEPDLDTLDEFSDGNIYELIAQCINEIEGIKSMTGLRTEDGDYLMFVNALPFEYTKAERCLTRDDLREIFAKYTSLVFEGSCYVDYCTAVEYG